MKANKSAETIQLRRDLARLLKRLRGIRREKLALHELRQRVSAALLEAGSLAQLVAVTSDGEEQACRFSVDKASLRVLEDSVCGAQLVDFR
jgi:hypothetical protein